MIVVDASVVLTAIADDDGDGDRARARLRDTRGFAPHVLDVEVLHALRRHVRIGLVSTPRAARAVADLQRMELLRVPHTGPLQRAWELRDNLSAFDAAYVALAEVLDVPLVTTDARLAAVPGIQCEVEVLATPA